MVSKSLMGYMGKILRVDLTSGAIQEEPLEDNLVEMYMGGTGFGAEYLYREVPPGVSWDDPENRIIIASGPLGESSPPFSYCIGCSCRRHSPSPFDLHGCVGQRGPG